MPDLIMELTACVAMSMSCSITSENVSSLVVTRSMSASAASSGISPFCQTFRRASLVSATDSPKPSV